MSGTQLNRAAAGSFILLVATVIPAFILLGLVEVDSARDKIGESLVDIDDDEAIAIVGLAIDMLTNIAAAVVAVVTYLLFRRRNQALALLSFGGQFISAILFTIATVASLVVVRLANDLADGGAGGAGEAEIVELARTVAAIVEFSQFAGLTFLGTGLIALGVLIALIPSPDAATRAISTVPRWVGGLVALSGTLMLFGWLTAVEQDLFVIAFIGMIGTLVTLLFLAGWLLRAPEEPETVS